MAVIFSDCLMSLSSFMVGQSANTGLLAFIVTYMGCFVIPPAGWLQMFQRTYGQAAWRRCCAVRHSVQKTVGGTTGSDLHGDLWQGCCTEISSGDTAVGIEFVIVWGLTGHGGFLSIEI